MSEKPITVVEMARMGGFARAKANSRAKIREWGRQGGRPPKLGAKALAKLREFLEKGKSQAECAHALGVSARTIGRVFARIKAGVDPSTL